MDQHGGLLPRRQPFVRPSAAPVLGRLPGRPSPHRARQDRRHDRLQVHLDNATAKPGRPFRYRLHLHPDELHRHGADPDDHDEAADSGSNTQRQRGQSIVEFALILPILAAIWRRSWSSVLPSTPTWSSRRPAVKAPASAPSLGNDGTQGVCPERGNRRGHGRSRDRLKSVHGLLKSAGMDITKVAGLRSSTRTRTEAH